MKADQFFNPASTAGWRRSLNVLLFTAGLGAVCFAVSAGRRNPAVPVNSGVAASVLAPDTGFESILSALPAAGSAASGQAVRAAAAQVLAHPAKAAPWVHLGDALAQCQRETLSPVWYEQAEKAYREALKRDASLTDAMAGLAWVYGGRHQFDLSVLEAERVLTLDPAHATSYGIIGDAAVELGEYDKAFVAYQKMMDLRPDLSSWSRGAHLLWLTGQQSRAVMLMEQAVRSGGPFAENTAWCRARLALMLFHDGALVPAAQALEPVLAKETRNLQVLLAAGRIAAARGAFPEAERHYRRVLENGPNHEALTGLGDLAAVQNFPAEAEDFYARVESLHQLHRQTGVHDHMEMARFLADHDRQPVEALRLALEHGEVRNAFEADTLAWVYFRNGNQPKAIEFIKRALKNNPPDAGIHYHAGCIAAAAGDRIAAQNHLQQAISRNAGFSLLQGPQAAKLLEDLGSTPPPVPASVLPSNTIPGQPLSKLR